MVTQNCIFFFLFSFNFVVGRVLEFGKLFILGQAFQKSENMKLLQVSVFAINANSYFTERKIFYFLAFQFGFQSSAKSTNLNYEMVRLKLRLSLSIHERRSGKVFLTFRGINFKILLDPFAVYIRRGEKN